MICLYCKQQIVEQANPPLAPRWKWRANDGTYLCRMRGSDALLPHIPKDQPQQKEATQ